MRIPTRNQSPIFIELVASLGPTRSAESIEDELRRILNTVVGRRFSPSSIKTTLARQILERVSRLVVRGRTPSDEIDLEGFFRSGAAQAARIRPFVAKSDLLLEYGGGIGRIATHLSGACRRLVSVDVNPLMSLYGTALCPGVEFRLLDEIPPEETFDFCYSVAVFFHLAEEEHRRALEYIHRRLKPGARAVIDLKLGPTAIPSSAETGYVRTTAADAFLSSCEEYFDMKVIELFNQAVVLTKRDTRPG